MSLSDEQRAIVDKASGLFLVRACPGSGKTYALAHRIIKEVDDWPHAHRGLAALSFTNAANDALLDQLNELGQGNILAPPHALSTIDSFICQHIFFPFAKTYLGLQNDLEMIGEPYTKFHSYNHYEEWSVELRRNIDGVFTFNKQSSIPNGQRQNVIKARESLNQKGMFTQDDANYYSLKILQKYPRIARSLAYRFPCIFIDEAQDSSDIQWQILHMIANQSHIRTFALIGDPDQAIYEWRGANPSLFTKFEAELLRKKQVYYLNESWRSSQAVCDFYWPLSTLRNTPLAVNPIIKDLDKAPSIAPYDNIADAATIVKSFLADSTENDRVIILSRSKHLIKLVNNSSFIENLEPWSIGKKNPSHPLSSSILSSRYYYDVGDYHNAHKVAEQILMTLRKIKKDDHELHTREEWKDWHKQVSTFLKLIPRTTSCTLGEWTLAANASLQQSNLPHLESIRFTLKVRNTRIDYSSMPIEDLFNNESNELSLQTIHAVKGQSADRVLLIMSENHVRDFIGFYKRDKSSNEDTRLFYVALTRAKQDIVLCIPKSMEAKLQAAINTQPLMLKFE